MKLDFYNKGSWIKGFLHLPKKKTDKLVILVHGFTGTRDGPAGLYVRTADALVKNGYAVYRFNFRFTDKTYREFQKTTIAGQVDDLRLVFRMMKKKLGFKKIAVIGESLGTVICTLSGVKADVFVLWYGFTFIRKIFEKRFLTKEKLELLKRQDYLEGQKSWKKERYKVGKKIINEFLKLDTSPQVRRIKTPTLVVHGDADISVPIIYGKILYRNLKSKKKFAIVKGAGHGFSNRYYRPSTPLQKKAIKVTLDWLKKEIN
ncbi:MAG TPA: alpha/beta fold hydrolase [archaeon]|nr:alpha/beta fold hydrolase [archaeon]